MVIDVTLLKRTSRKGRKSVCRTRVVAIGFSHKGDYVGMCTNRPNLKKHGGGFHAELELLKKFGAKRIRSILLVRVSSAGIIKPMHTCARCWKVLAKHGIRVQTVEVE